MSPLLKNLHQENALFRSRLTIAMIFIAIAFGLMVTRLFYLQVLEHDKYATLSDNNRITLLPLPPNRGLIYDRKGVLLADNIPTFTLAVVPEQTEDLKQTIDKLSALVTITEEDKQRFYREKNRRRRFEGIPLRVNLTEDEAATISVNLYKLPGVNVVASLSRSYPHAEVFSHVIGYVGRINEEELKQLDETAYSGTLFIGKTGVEKHYESLLHGTVGYQKVETDAKGRILRILETKPPVSGSHLYLSIDSELQLAAEAAFEKGRGAIVAIEPKTGAVLAFVSQPGFDPNPFVTGISQADYKALSTDIDQPLYNRALRGLYPPASTVKPMLGLTGLEAGIITPAFSIYDPGYFRLGGRGRPYRDWLKGGHGSVNVHRGIVVSCDTFFYTLANKWGIEGLAEAFRSFGYGSRTGIDIFGETAGLVPTPDWKRGRYNEAWYPGETVITGIGQGYTLVTPLQLAHGVATLANRGVRLQPHVVERIEAPDGNLSTPTLAPLKPVKASDANWNLVLDAMRGVVDNGTARYIHTNEYPIAGKTGTAQVFSLPPNATYRPEQLAEHLRDHSLFIGFAPADNPKIAVAVIRENEKKAAVLAKEVFDTYLEEELLLP